MSLRFKLTLGGAVQGTVVQTVRDGVTVHTYTSPESGLAVTTHIVELASQLIVVDGQYGMPFAVEAATVARSLGKPISRVYVSHDHPDHWFGAGAFDAPVYALVETRDAIAANGPQMIANNRAAVGDFVAETATIPTVIVMPGTETIDGVRFEFSAVHETEAATMLIIALPEQSIVFAQDLVYDNLHLFVAEANFDGWRMALESLQAAEYRTVLPGHGAPGGPELYEFVFTYLAAAQEQLAKATTGADFKDALIAEFPKAGGTALLDIQNGYIFPQA